MENTAHNVPGNTSRTAPATASRTALEWFGLVVLALFVLLAGAVVGVVGPLLGIACATCQDGVRGPLRFGGALIVLAQYGVPLVTLGTVAGVFHPRGGARAGGIGLGLLGVLFCAILALGRITA